MRFSIGWAPVWYFGYQTYTDPVGIWTIDLFVIPPLRISCGWRGYRWWG